MLRLKVKNLKTFTLNGQTQTITVKGQTGTLQTKWEALLRGDAPLRLQRANTSRVQLVMFRVSGLRFGALNLTLETSRNVQGFASRVWVKVVKV